MIPTQLFNGAPEGNYIRHTYTVYANGTFSASDDHGSSFGWDNLAGTPPGITTTRLQGNTTAAYVNYFVANSNKVLANFTFSYKVRYQFCQPAGLKIKIEGWTDWGTQNSGSIVLKFNKDPILLKGSRAWFGNNSGVGLGFDWSDSAPSSTFDRPTRMLSWRVGPLFSIDPTTVGTSSTGTATEVDNQRRLFFASSRYWFFYSDGTNYVWRTSSDGSTWSVATNVRSIGNGHLLSVWIDGSNNVYYAFADGSATNFAYRYGVANSDGTITWSITETTVPIPGFYGQYPYIYAGATNDIWVCLSDAGSMQVWRYDGTSFSQKKSVPVSLIQVCSIHKTASGIAALYGSQPSNSAISVMTTGNNGATWTTPVATATSFAYQDSAATVIGDTLHLVATDTSTTKYESCTYPCGSWSSETTLSGLSGVHVVSITTDNSNTLVALEESYTKIAYFTSTNSGGSWGPETILGSESSIPLPSLVTGYTTNGGMAYVGWTAGSASPFNVRFASFPPIVPTAVSSSNSWSKPGLAPYQGYFANLDEYTSPGNGLLGIRQVDLYLPGRGLDLGIARVFGTPYAFRATSPFQYDNYTLANLGYGWTLDFPWLGTYYLHLSSGQAYPYQWNGNTFEYHKAVDFKLVNSGSGYTLYTKSGTLYQFDVNKRLTSITDRTGNNVITFTYGTNSYISQITDTTGRAVTFSYNINNQLASITSAGRTWSYSYSGSNLVSMTDPANRVTTYQYGTGINSWLISAVLYPTGGKSTYGYGNAPVGTEVKTYYVTSRNIYYSSTALSQSSSISYNILNGNVIWSNATISDGVTTQAYQNYNFQSGNNLMKLYDKSSTGSLIRITEYDYDASGRISQSKLYSPTNTLLASAQTYYDSWGNVKQTHDFVGHDRYFSYANTDSQNTFGVTGFSNSFYTPLTISANIFNALVGVAEFQNGPGTTTMETYYKYDSSGNILEQKQIHNVAGQPTAWLLTDHTYDTYGNRLSAIDALSRTTYFRYSSTYSSAYLTKQSILVGTQNVTSTYTYDSAKGFLLSQTEPNGFTTSYQYDVLGRLTQVTYPTIGGVTAFKQYGYDDTNNILTITDENGNVAKQYYDGLARPTKVERYNGTLLYSSETYTNNWISQVASKTTPIGSTYSYSYDSYGRLTKVTNPDTTFSTISYDDVNNVKTVTDENGHFKTLAYDWNNRLTTVKEYYSLTSYYLTSYSYDQIANLLGVTDAKNNVTSYQYDDLNRLIKTTYPDATFETRTYDNVGNLLTRTDPRNNQMGYTYDALNRLTKVTYPDTSTVTYNYDANSNRVSMVDPSFSTYYTYDARNRMTNETKYITAVKYSLLYSYDKVGNIVTMTYPDTYALSFTYDAVNRVRKLVGTGTTFGLFTYTLDDKIKTVTYGNGEVATYSYDTRSRPTRILVMSGATKRLDLNYTYDGTGNVLTLNTETYAYDWLDRITSSSYTGGWGSITYSYDGTGNRLSMVQGGTTTTYTYGKFNRLTKAVAGATTSTYTYDANGNLATKNDGVYLWTYTYDFENRLTKVQQGTTTMEQMVYDGDGKAIQNIQTNTVVSIWKGFDIIYQKNLGTNTISKYFMANGLRIAEMIGSTVYYYHQDILGSTRLLSTSTPVATQFSSNYVPYGPNYGSAGTEVFQYTGKPQDTITGYYNFGARYYDPTIGRFVTQDSYSGSKTDPQSLNRYAYARNNPEKFIDPNGHVFTGPLLDSQYSVGAALKLFPATKVTPKPTTTSSKPSTFNPNAVFGQPLTNNPASTSAASPAKNTKSGTPPASGTASSSGLGVGGTGIGSPVSNSATTPSSSPVSTVTTSTSTSATSSSSCTAAGYVCDVLNFGNNLPIVGGNPYAKIGAGAGMTIGAAMALVLLPLTPVGDRLIGQVASVGGFGLMLEFSGAAQLGYEFGTYLQQNPTSTLLPPIYYPGG